MEIKFKKNIDQYKYLVMFDLASKITGVCLWDIQNHKPIETQILKVTGKYELPVAELFELIHNYFGYLQHEYHIDLKDVLVGKEAMPSQLHGGSSTVQTFIALSRSHSILDNYLYQHNIDCYDYKGVAPITTHAYYKQLANLDSKAKVDKEMIRQYLYNLYNLTTITLDESDAIFLAKTLLEVKWNRDLDEAIREEKRHRKTLKAAHAINLSEEEIKRLKSLKNAF